MRFNNKGFVSIVIFFLIIAIAVVFMPIVMQSITYHTMKEHENAFFLAESGLKYYINKELVGNSDWTKDKIYPAYPIPTIPNMPFGSGSFTVGPKPGSVLSPANITLQSTGFVTVGSVTFKRILKQTVRRESPFDSAIKAYGSSGITVELSGQAYTDSYDSSLGRYNVNGNISNHGDVITNGSISLTGQSQINGAQTPNANMTCPTTPIKVPDDLAGLTPVSALSVSGQNTVNITGDHKYTSITLSGQSKLIVTGPSNIYVTGNWSISGQSLFSVSSASTGPVIIYIDGNISASGQGITNDTYIPSNLQIYGTALQNWDSSVTYSINKNVIYNCSIWESLQNNNLNHTPVSGSWWSSGAPTQTFTFSGQAALYGAIFSPFSNMTISGQGGIYGAVVGYDITMSGQSTIHFDEALKNLSLPGSTGGSGGLIFQDWKEITF